MTCCKILNGTLLSRNIRGGAAFLLGQTHGSLCIDRHGTKELGRQDVDSIDQWEGQNPTNSQTVSLNIMPSKTDRGLSIYRSSILLRDERRKGFASSLIFSCEQKNEPIACTLWEIYEPMTPVPCAASSVSPATSRYWTGSLPSE